MRLSTIFPIFLFTVPLLIGIVFWELRNRLSRRVVLLAVASYLVPFLISLAYFLWSGESYMLLFWGFRVASLLSFAAAVLVLIKVPSLGSRFAMLFYLAFVVHACIAWLGFLSVSFRNFLFSIQNIGPMTEVALRWADFTTRLPTLGAMFFSSGILYAMCSALLLAEVASKLEFRWRYWVLFAFLAVTGAFIARTALLGPIVGFFFLLNRNWKRNLLELLLAGVVACGVLSAMTASTKFEPLVQWGFEPVINLFQKGTLSTRSSTETINTGALAASNFVERTKIEPSSWLFGAGRMTGDDQISYYGKADIGYVRMMLYGGVPYVFAFFIPALFAVLIAFVLPFSSITRRATLITLLVQLICNLKGLIDISATTSFVWIIYEILRYPHRFDSNPGSQTAFLRSAK
ncbi:MAG: hypothetical protein EOP06_12190 [Proteobacteria bacterium]|nr:MAG: hypothetical protein EOP06_12190 [Pseudomonadota bacterium]